jgi:hypothetical protein
VLPSSKRSGNRETPRTKRSGDNSENIILGQNLKKGSKRILNSSLDAGRQKVGSFIKGGKKDGVIVESNKSGLWPTKRFDGKSDKDGDR